MRYKFEIYFQRHGIKMEYREYDKNPLKGPVHSKNCDEDSMESAVADRRNLSRISRTRLFVRLFVWGFVCRGSRDESGKAKQVEFVPRPDRSSTRHDSGFCFGLVW